MSKKLEYPERVVSVSDCHGGHRLWHPFTSPDVVERLTQSVRSDLPEVQRFDNYGTSPSYNRYIVEAAERLHTQHQPDRRTGLFINSAPRTKKDSNGQPFYRAELDHGLVVVATPLSVLSGVRDRVRNLYRLPNEQNELYDGSREQHRSSYTPRLLADNHGLDLEAVDLTEIPELPPHCELDYVDRFGNLVIGGDEESITQLQYDVRGVDRKPFRLRIGNRGSKVYAGESLAASDAGRLTIYPNDTDVEILSKWDPRWSHKERLSRSAWSQFGKPDVGTDVGIDTRKFVSRILRLAI
ncbi:MAG: hypothetical protein ABII02_01305 [Candidatus Magasanikbacteria bacterium]